MLSSQYALGIFAIVLVAVIWTASSILSQFLYQDEDFESPFLLTYIGTSLFVLFLPTHWLWEHCGNGDTVIPWTHNHSSHHPLPVEEESEEEEEESSHSTSQQHPEWSHIQHLKAALKIAPIWFAANWTYNASLVYTSITSSTVLASTGSLFTFLFAVLSQDENFSWTKLLGVLLGFMGSLLTTWNDHYHHDGDHHHHSATHNRTTTLTANTGPATPSSHHYLSSSAENERALLGDCLGLLSAIGYGAYTVLLRKVCPHDESLFRMQLLLGYVGCINAILLSPICLGQLLYGNTGLTWIVFGFLLLKGLFDNVLSDYLWAHAVILTSATVATVGLGITIPMAFVSDWLLGHAQALSWNSVLAALAVLLGFGFVNLGNQDDKDEHHDEPQPPEEHSAISSSDHETTATSYQQHETMTSVGSTDPVELT